MRFIKVFADDDAYKEYRDGGSYEMPNVSLSKGNNTRKVYYNVDAKGYGYVDLKLPSGTLWATCNVGASEASEAGLYFQWGDTSGYTADQVGINDKKYFDWSDYKWSIDGSSTNFSKYTTKGDMLELEDDAAHVNMGGDWHMPTPAQFKEFKDNTTTAWTASNGVSGVTFTSKKDSSKSIFIPAAGYAANGFVDENGNWGGVWAPMLGSEQAGSGLVLVSANAGITSNLNQRCNGCSVRGVIG